METKQQYNTFQDWLKDNYEGPRMATDIIIRHDDRKKDGIVFIERKYPPQGIALPGGMAERITFEQNAMKEGKEETGLNIEIDYPHRPFCEYSDPDQDPRAFISTVCYTGRGYGILKPQPEEDAKRAIIVTISELEKLLSEDIWAFSHHKKILSLYLNDEDYRSNLK